MLLSPILPSSPLCAIRVLESRQHALLHPSQRPLALAPPRPDPPRLFASEPPRRRRRIVPQPAPPRHRLIGQCLVARPAVGARVDRDHARTAQAQVVRERDARARDEAVVGPAAQMPGQFGALGQTGGAERVAFGEETAGGVDEDSMPGAALLVLLLLLLALLVHTLLRFGRGGVGGAPFTDKLVRLTRFGDAQSVQKDHLRRREAVVQFAHLDFEYGAQSGLLQRGFDYRSRHPGADKVGCGPVE